MAKTVARIVGEELDVYPCSTEVLSYLVAERCGISIGMAEIAVLDVLRDRKRFVWRDGRWMGR